MEDFEVPFILHEECSQIFLGCYYFLLSEVTVYQIAFSEYFIEDAKSQTESREIHYDFQIFFTGKLEMTLFEFN